MGFFPFFVALPLPRPVLSLSALQTENSRHICITEEQQNREMPDKNCKSTCPGPIHCKGSIFISPLTTLLFILVLLGSFGQVLGSIHVYQNVTFTHRSNSFFFHGGSEGLFASRAHYPSVDNLTSEDNPISGKSFIRCLLLHFHVPSILREINIVPS